jgi:hypothetical protein
MVYLIQHKSNLGVKAITQTPNSDKISNPLLINFHVQQKNHPASSMKC